MEAEQVTENYERVPGRMASRTIWIAYPDHVAGYGQMHNRVSRAWGRGKTKAEALANAEQGRSLPH